MRGGGESLSALERVSEERGITSSHSLAAKPDRRTERILVRIIELSLDFFPSIFPDFPFCSPCLAISCSIAEIHISFGEKNKIIWEGGHSKICHTAIVRREIHARDIFSCRIMISSDKRRSERICPCLPSHIGA